MRDLLLWMDATWQKNNPLNSVKKLAAIMTKTKGNEEYAEWVIACIADRICSRQSSLQDGWSMELLTGERDKSNKGIIDLCMFKLEVCKYLLGPILETHAFQSEAKETVRMVFKSHASFRQLYKPLAETMVDGGDQELGAVASTPAGSEAAAPPGSVAETLSPSEPDLSFMAAWRTSTEKLCDLVELYGFTSKEDGLLKVAMKARKTAADFFTGYDAPKEKIAEVLKAIADETTMATPVQPARGAVAAEAGETSTVADNPDDMVQVELRAHGLDESHIAAWKQKAERKAKAFVKLVSIKSMSEQDVQSIISESAPGKAMATTLLYDPKLVGESRTAPHIRQPPFQESHCLLCVSSFTSARGKVGHVGPGDQILIFDGTKKGLNTTSIPRAFQDEGSTRVKSNFLTQICLVYSQQNLMQRRRATRTIEGLRQIETINIFTHRPLTLPYRKRRIFKDCSQDNMAPVIGTVFFEKWEQSWTLPYKEKKKVFGDFHTSVGGAGGAEPVADDPAQEDRTPSAMDDPDSEMDATEDTLPGRDQLVVKPGRLSKTVTREEDNVEPVFMHSLAREVHTEMIHSFAVQAMVDATPGAGNAAFACMQARVGYLGLCLSEEHKNLLMDQLIQRVFKDMLKEDSPLSEPGLQQAIHAKEETPTRPKREQSSSSGRAAKKACARPAAACARPAAEVEKDTTVDSEDSDAGEL